MRIALITGGASGLGLASAKRLALDGYRVVIADLDAQAARGAAASLAGAEHAGIAVDVGLEASVDAMFESVESTIGHVGVLGCFAGINSASPNPGRVPLVDITVDEWDRVMDINARGTFLCVREMLRRRKETSIEHGRIITVSSVAGQIGGLQSGAAYSASKGAVLSLTKVAAREAASMGITVNSIAPGPIDTPMLRETVSPGNEGQKYLGVEQVPLKRVGEAEEIAAATSFLASIEAGYLTGATIDVNGGLNMR
jgi:3-oxoacyl-[acyl-carrier protein] reductase